MYLRILLLSALIAGIEPAIARDEYGCIADYMSDFEFGQAKLTSGTTDGVTGQVRWGPHGYIGKAFFPSKTDGSQPIMATVETFYLWLNCQWGSVDAAYADSLTTFTGDKRCIALSVSNDEAIFDCGRGTTAIRKGYNELGPYKEVRSTGTGLWRCTSHFADGLALLENLERKAIDTAANELRMARALSSCATGLEPKEQVWLDKGDDFAAYFSPGYAEATIRFTVRADGTVGQILQRQGQDYMLEYILAYNLRNWHFPASDAACSHAWTHHWFTRP